MKKFKFYTSSSSDEEHHNSDTSDDEIPDLNVPSKILMNDHQTLQIEQLFDKHIESNTTQGNKQITEKSNENESDKEKMEYKSYLAQKTKRLLGAFTSDSEDETAKNNKNINENKDSTKSTTTSSGYENNDNIDSDASEKDEKEIPKEDLNKKTLNQNEHSIENQKNPRPVVRMNLKMPEIPVGKRQQKLMSSIKMIYDFFDHKIPVQSIIYAIHDHAGMLKDAVTTLNQYPNKYDNYSLHNLPSNATQVYINNYLRILS